MTIYGTTRSAALLAKAIACGADYKTNGALWGRAGINGAYTIGSYARPLYSRPDAATKFTFHLGRGSVTTSRHIGVAIRAIGPENIFQGLEALPHMRVAS